jgi:hypothetical protein
MTDELYAYRVVCRIKPKIWTGDPNENKWKPVRQRTYSSLSTARAIKTNEHSYWYHQDFEFKIQRMPVGIWEDVE